MTTPDAIAAGLTVVLGESLRQLLFSSAARARARRTAGSTIYDVTLAGRLIFTAAIVIIGGLIVAVLVDGDDWRITLLLAPFLVLCLAGIPGSIRVDPANGVSTRRWYGRTRRIAWREVIDVRGPDGIGQVIVSGANGQKIVHTGLHAGAAAFRRQVLQYARVSPTRIVPA
jgi:hypothetical protein